MRQMALHPDRDVRQHAILFAAVLTALLVFLTMQVLIEDLNGQSSNPQPYLFSIDPKMALLGASTYSLTVTLSGFNFISSSRVLFDGLEQSTTYVSLSTLQADICVCSPGTHTFSVRTPSPGGGDSNAIPFSIVSGTSFPVPSISSVSPTMATISFGTFGMTVNGSNFYTGSQVRWNGTDVYTSFQSNSQLTASVFGGVCKAGTNAVTVFTPSPGGGTSNSAPVTVNAVVPSISSLSPNAANAGDPGFSLTVTGDNFACDSVVRWNGSDRVTTLAGSNTLTADIPALDIAEPGTASVTVFTPGTGGGSSNPLVFTIAASNPPYLFSVDPKMALLGAGTYSLNVTLNGANFVLSSKVVFDGLEHPTAYVNSSTLRADICVCSSGTHTFSVRTPSPGGGDSNAIPFSVVSGTGFPVPSISSVSPTMATISLSTGGLGITVNGANFYTGSQVRWNETDIYTSFQSNSQLAAVTRYDQVSKAGTGIVTVFNPAPGGGASNSATVTINAVVPLISSISPNTATAGHPGFSLTVIGSNFASDSVIRWNGQERPTAPPAFGNHTTRTATIPASDIASPGTASVTVFTPGTGGGSSNSLPFVVSPGERTITNIERFLEKCPGSDPAYARILSDFKIRRNGILITDFPCSEPVSQMPLSQYTDPLIVLQGLRVLYYMDRGQSGHLPWTSGTVYDWMKSKIGGFNVSDTAASSYCCEIYDGVFNIVVSAQDDFNRDFDRFWRGIAGNLDLYAHETRHVDGFPHTSCCGIPAGCDQTYDESNLSPYGIQWWLNKSWLMGDLYVGFSCLAPNQAQEIADWHLAACNSVFQNRFCDTRPAELTLPDFPGGQCRTDTTGVFRPSNGALYLKVSNSAGFADAVLTYGLPGDHPIVGDWDGDGVDTIGIYRDGTFYLRNSNTNGFADIVLAFGVPGDQPVVGDWDGDGITTIGIYRNGTFYLRNSNTTGPADLVFSLGIPADIGITGDWDGDGTVTTGVFRPSNGALYLKNSNTTGFADIVLTYGLPGDVPVTGDWNADGIDTIGVYRSGTFYLRNSNTNGFADMTFALGISGDYPIGGRWGPVDRNERKVYVNSFGSNAVSVVDPSSDSVTKTISVGAGPGPIRVIPGSDKVYVGNYQTNTISVVNTSTDTVIRTIEVGLGSCTIVAQPNGSKAYVTHQNSNSVSVIDISLDSVIKTIPVGSQPCALAMSPDGTKVYVANQGEGSVSVIDATTDTVTRTIPVGSSPYPIVFTPNGSKAYVVNGSSDSVSVIDAVSDTELKRITVGTNPRDLAVRPDGLKAYVLNDGGSFLSSVSVIDTMTDTVTKTVGIGGFDANLIALSPNGRKAYVAHTGSPFALGDISVLDLGTETVTKSFGVGNAPSFIAFTPDGKKAYVSNHNSANLSVIDAAIDSEIAKIPVGNQPVDIAIMNKRKPSSHFSQIK